APSAQSKVVFGGAALVAVAFDGDSGVGEIGEDTFQRIEVTQQRGPGVFTNVVGVVIEVGVAKIRKYAGFQRPGAARRRGAGRRRRRPGNSNGGGRRGIAERAVGRDRVGGGFGRDD